MHKKMKMRRIAAGYHRNREDVSGGCFCGLTLSSALADISAKLPQLKTSPWPIYRPKEFKRTEFTYRTQRHTYSVISKIKWRISVTTFDKRFSCCDEIYEWRESMTLRSICEFDIFRWLVPDLLQVRNSQIPIAYSGGALNFEQTSLGHWNLKVLIVPKKS